MRDGEGQQHHEHGGRHRSADRNEHDQAGQSRTGGQHRRAGEPHHPLPGVAGTFQLEQAHQVSRRVPGSEPHGEDQQRRRQETGQHHHGQLDESGPAAPADRRGRARDHERAGEQQHRGAENFEHRGQPGIKRVEHRPDGVRTEQHGSGDDRRPERGRGEHRANSAAQPVEGDLALREVHTGQHQQTQHHWHREHQRRPRNTDRKHGVAPEHQRTGTAKRPVGTPATTARPPHRQVVDGTVRHAEHTGHDDECRTSGPGRR